MITRFVPVGYQPQWTSENIVDKVGRAVAGLGDLIDDYEFHYPQEINEGNVAAIKNALGGHGIYCVATGLHLDPLFGRGGLCSPDASIRAEAVRRTLAAADMAGSPRADFIIWPGIEGYNYPFQSPYRESWAWLIQSIGAGAQKWQEQRVKLFLQHKNLQPAMKN